MNYQPIFFDFVDEKFAQIAQPVEIEKGGPNVTQNFTR